MSLDKETNDRRVETGSDVPVGVEIPVRNGPISGIAISPDGRQLMVSNNGTDSVSMIDARTCRVTDTVGVAEPFVVAMGGIDRAYISMVSQAYDAIAVIDVATREVIATHPLALTVSDFAVSADGQRIYACRNGVRGADVAVLDTNTGEVAVVDLTVDTGQAPGTTTECIRLSPDEDRLYVGVNGPDGGRFVVIATRPEAGDETNRSSGRPSWRRKAPKKAVTPLGQGGALEIVDTIEIGLPIRDIAISPNGGVGYVASCDPEVGTVIDVLDIRDTRDIQITATHKIGEINGNLTRFTLSSDGNRAYLVSDDSVTVLGTQANDVIGVIAAVKQPSCVVESRDGSQLYIADYSGAVVVVPVSAATAGFSAGLEETDASTEWVMPELLQYEAALA